MNRFFKNNHNLTKSLYALAVVIIAIIFYRCTENIQISNILPVAIDVIYPFIGGAIIAYLLNCGTRFIENNILVRFKYFQSSDPKIRKRMRLISISVAAVLLLGIIAAIISYIIPEIISSAQNVINFVVKIDYNALHDFLNSILRKYNIDIGVSAYRSLLDALDNFISKVVDSLKYVPNMVLSLVTHTISLASSIVNVIISIMVAFYILIDKEEIVDISQKVLYTVLPEKAYNITALYINQMNKTFNHFFVGKAVDSTIIGIIFFIGAVIMNLPYPLLFSLVIGITNMIPYFGPFIGAVPVVALTVLVAPIKAIWTLIFILVLQQFDGVILGPRILGESIGLKPIGVIFAIIVGGAIAGPLGMFFGVPIFACITDLLFELINRSYDRKTLTKEAE